MRQKSRHRPERLAALVRETLARAIATLVKDPRVGFVTLTDVTVTPDGSHATVLVSVLGAEEDKQRALEGLDSAKGFLRSHLASVLTLRVVPDLTFRLDRGVEHAQRIDQIIHQIKHDGPDT
ncbi:MAG TPA: 30S ribosome-binding factor RbfA [Gemmatimonadales bacterium]